jgi:hypothetical protein
MGGRMNKEDEHVASRCIDLSALRQVPKRNEAGVGVQEIRGTRALFWHEVGTLMNSRHGFIVSRTSL